MISSAVTVGPYEVSSGHVAPLNRIHRRPGVWNDQRSSNISCDTGTPVGPLGIGGALEGTKLVGSRWLGSRRAGELRRLVIRAVHYLMRQM